MLRYRYLYAKPKHQPIANSADQGFTLIETLVVLAIVGVLGAIAAPNWLSMLNKQRLNAAQDQAHQTMRQAQSKASYHHTDWEAGFRESNNIVQMAVYAANSTPTQVVWRSLEENIRIDTAETTLAQTNGIYRIQFDAKGNLNGQLGRLTFDHLHGGKMRRCIFTSTLLGTLRKGSEQPNPDESGRYCY
jgi:prepilin-type N-terminal cleavage/methylation domain-containing protein